MKGSITDIKKTWIRRVVLCSAIVPAVLVYMFMETVDRIRTIFIDAVNTFKDVWKEESLDKGN